jgi:predicted MFS family arabinose efflux permease
MGLLFLFLSALGSGLASSFNTLLVSYSLSGLGMAMVVPTAFSIIGDLFPLEKRARAIGWVIAGMSLSAVIGAPVVNFIADIKGWRMAFLGFVLPISLLSLLLAARALPSPSMSRQPMVRQGSYLVGFKMIFSNRSATACLIGDALSMASLQANILYGVSFFRQRFLLSIGFATIHFMMSNICYTIGSLSGGRLVNKFGRKQSTILSHFLLGVFIISFTNLPNVWISLILAWLGGFFAGVSYSALSSLTLEQTPRFRGTMMSLFSAIRSLGAALGAGIGGLMLLLYDYGFLGISLGAMSIIAAIIFYFYTTDPTKSYSQSERDVIR